MRTGAYCFFLFLTSSLVGSMRSWTLRARSLNPLLAGLGSDRCRLDMWAGRFDFPYKRSSFVAVAALEATWPTKALFATWCCRRLSKQALDTVVDTWDDSLGSGLDRP